MPEPDIPPIHLSSEFVEELRSKLPRMPQDYREMFSSILPADTIEILLDYQPLIAKLAELYADNDDKTAKDENAPTKSVKKIANLFTSVLLAEENTSLLNDELPTKRQLLDLAEMIEKSELSSTGAKEVFLKFFDPEMHTKDTRTIAKELNVLQENDSGALEAIVDQVIADPACAKAVADFKAGSEKVLGFLVGQVMKASKGKANPAAVQPILRKKLS